MATVCTQCGTELPREDARFCNNCGTLVPDHLLSPHTRVAANEDAPDKVNDAQDSTSSLQEQVARQPFAQSKKSDNSNVTPWLGIQGYDAPTPSPRPEQREQSDAPEPRSTSEEAQPGSAMPAIAKGSEQKSMRPAPARPTDNSGSGGNANVRRLGQGGRLGRKGTAEGPVNFIWPEPLTHVMSGHDQAGDSQDAPQVVFPVLPSTPPPARDLHTKIWDDVEDAPTVTDVPAPTSEPAASQPAAAQSQAEEIEDLPTQSLSSTDLEDENSTETTLTHLPTVSLSSVSPSAQPGFDGQKQANAALSQEPVADEDIEQMPTAQWQKPEVVREPTPARPGSPGRSRDSSVPGLASYPPVPDAQPPAPAVGQASMAASAQQNRETPLLPAALLQPASATLAKARKHSPLVAIVAAILICALALGGWIILAHPFAASADITPLQPETDNAIGLSMEYPAGWSSNPAGSTLKLADSSNTAQITIARSDAGSTDLAKYLQQQATKMGMSDAKAGSATTFAGTSWQQISGDFQLSGASYVGTIYAGIHNNQLYTWTQIAPKNVAQDEESLVFAPARSSLHLH